MYIKAYSEPMAYSEIFRTIDISSLFQAPYSGINQEKFLHILNFVQVDSGIARNLADLGTYCFRHIQANYIPRYIYIGIFVHIQAYFSRFKCIQESCTNVCSSSHVLFKSLFKYIWNTFWFLFQKLTFDIFCSSG